MNLDKDIAPLSDNHLVAFVMGAVAFVIVMLFASWVGAERAKAQQACYEAAKLNPNITCTEGDKDE